MAAQLPIEDSSAIISVVIPSHNSSSTLRECLSAVFASDYRRFEVLVVDDASEDGSDEIAKSYPVNLTRLPGNMGAAYARNQGIDKAKGEIVLFLDSDIIIRDDSLSRVMEDFNTNPQVDGVAGIYSKATRYRGFFSRYKHSVWRYRFMMGDSQEDSFTTAFLAVKRQVLKKRRFDEAYKAASIEDIELGRMLIESGHRFMLDKGLEAEHVKSVSFGLFCRNQFARSKDIAMAWRSKNAQSFYLKPSRKNKYAKNYILRVPLSMMMILMLAAALLSGNVLLLTVPVALVIASAYLEGGFLEYCRSEYGILFAIGCVLAYFIDGAVSGAGVLAGAMQSMAGGRM